MKIQISWFAHAKIMHWVKKAETKEVSGYGTIDRTPDGGLLVTDAFLIKQENTGGSTEMEPAAIAKEMFLRKDQGAMNFWWHSHHSMSAYMSKTDEDTIKEFGANGWLLATVFNNRNEHKTVLFTSEPFSLYLDQFTLEIQSPQLNTAAATACDADYEAKVTEKKWGPPSGYLSGSEKSENVMEDWHYFQGAWYYTGEGQYNAKFQPPLPWFLENGLRDGRFEYDEEHDCYRLLPIEDRKRATRELPIYRGVHSV